MALTIGFDATPVVRQTAGIGRYARELLAALAEREDEVSYHLYYCAGGSTLGWLPPLNKRFRVRAMPVSDRVMNAVWHRWQLPLPVQLIAGHFDVFHSPDFTLPPALGRPSIVTIYDLAFFRHPDCAYPTLRAYLETMVPRSARRADRIVAISENTRRDVLEILDIPPERVTVVPAAAGRDFRPVGADRARVGVNQLGISEPYILSVGTLEPRKNYVRLLEAYAVLRQRGVRHRLVIAGRRGWLYEPIFARLDELRLTGSVTFVTPDDVELAALYGAADAFVYPSLYEGFGIPPLEALASGTPVACSSTASLPEVVGDVAVTFEPTDIEQIAGSLWRILCDAELRRDLKRRGPVRAATFSWQQSAEQMVNLYRSLGADG